MTSFPDGRVPVLLSAHDADLVSHDANAILGYLDGRQELADVADVAATLLRTRRLRRHLALVRAGDRAELMAGLQALAAGDDHPLVTRSAGSGPRVSRIAFVFPGQGSQWPSMGVEAYERLPEYRAEVDGCAPIFAAAGAASPLSYLLADAGAETTDFSQVQIQGAQFVHGVALARVWRSCGVLPDVTVGHSLGEVGAAYVAGAVTLADAVGIVVARATVLDRLTGPYRVAVLGITPDAAQDVIAETPGWLELSVVNSPTSVAVSGDTAAIAAVVGTVAARGFFAREIEMWFPAHTSALDGVGPELETLLPAGRFTETPVQFIGSATADVVAAGTDFADYWYANLRSTVRFDRAVRAAVDRGARTFVELSAHPALLFAMGDLLDDTTDGSVLLVGSGRRDEPLLDRLSANVAAVALADPGRRWADLLDTSRIPLGDFPFAPMRTQHMWATPDPLPPVAGLTVAAERWVPIDLETPTAVRHVAVLESDADGRVAGALRTAIDRTGGVRLVAAGEADLLVVIAPAIDDDDVSRAADELSRLVGNGLLDYADAITPRSRDVWLVTVGGERVRPGDAGARPAQSALAAMHRCVGFEHPDQEFGHLDLPNRDLDDTTAAVAVTALLGAGGGVALRADDSGPVAHRRSMVDATLPRPQWPAESATFDDVVITGGAGAVGLHYARHLADRGARRITLLSRGGVDAAVLAELNATPGVEVLAPRCDVTDPAQVSATAAELSADGASLVVHAAGAAVIAPRQELTDRAVRTGFAAKVIGLDVVLEAWPLRPDTRIVLCSSVSGPWGGLGHAAYSAANRLLDVRAAQLRAAGRHCTSMRWGLWPGAGIIDSDEVIRVERSGLRAMSPDRAVAASLRDFAFDPLLYTAEPDRLAAFLGAARPSHDVATADADSSPADAAGAVRAALGSVLKVADVAGIDLGAPLLDIGIDSLLALDLRKTLKTATGQSVPLATILGGATAAELIEHLKTTEKKALSRD